MRTFFFLICLIFTSTFFLSNSEKAALTPYKFPNPVAFPAMPQSSDNPVTIEGVALGRFLFYDPILSKDKTISCASCHKQEFAFSDSPNKFSKGINGQVQKRNTPPLFNLAWYQAYFWDGRAVTIEDQIFFPVRDHLEMNLDWPTATRRIQKSKFYRDQFDLVFGEVAIDSILISKAIAQFERTLISHNSKFDRVLRREDKLTTEEFRGFEIMNDQSMADCLHCHSTDANALATSGKFGNNGIDAVEDPLNYRDFGLGGYTGKLSDYGKFKIPSLRNIVLTAPYMHDGRFKTIRDVIDFYSTGLNHSANLDAKMTHIKTRGVQLTEYDKNCLEAFLLTLTDSVFISNSEHSNPFTIQSSKRTE
ncbi:MAG: cytochrome-c peroxidase [Crocinitomicaceae bacterium]|nr:cytochrome-c peroxidase [Crocinitomicaceae bacterium]